MNKFLSLKSFLGPSLPSPGLYQFDFKDEHQKSRVHLRLEQDYNGTLIVNANRIFYLNPTAALIAHSFLSGDRDEDTVRLLCKNFSVSQATALIDYTQTKEQIYSLLYPDSACPICDLDVEVNSPFTARPSSPYRMDLALTYRCNNDCSHCYNVSDRQDPELSTDQWKSILDQLWEIGIPHIVFTGGEPTLRNDLPELIAHAEGNGQITGVNTNGRRLSDPDFVNRLIEAGLDHIQITLESHDPEIHDAMMRRKGAWKQTTAGIRNALETRLFVMTNTTMLDGNTPGLDKTLDFLAELGVPTVGLNALIYSGRGASVGTGLKESDLPTLLDLASTKLRQNGQRLIWYTPTQYCHFDPVQMELGVKGCTAALFNMCIEPDGAVLPCQSFYRPVGNILKNSWKSIWEHDLCIWLRERNYVPDQCLGCALLQECGGGCPLRLEFPEKNKNFIPISKLAVSDVIPFSRD